MATYNVSGTIDARNINIGVVDKISFNNPNANLLLNASQFSADQISDTVYITTDRSYYLVNVGLSVFGDQIDASGWQFGIWISGAGRQGLSRIYLSGGDSDVNIIGSLAPDNITGGAGNDILYGGGSDTNGNVFVAPYGNTIDGSGGDDRIISTQKERSVDGGIGNDTLVVDRSGATIALSTYAYSNTQLNIQERPGTFEYAWSAVNIEHVELIGGLADDSLYGLSDTDTLYGNAGSDHLYGEQGNDFLSGGDGFDTLIGADGNDTLDGGSDVDYLNGGAEYDSLLGGRGADTLDGGEGFDYAAYHNAASGLLVDLNQPSLNSGDAAGDIFYSIEGLTGSAFSDTLSGDGGANWLYGNGGADFLYGRAGSDTVLGGEGADWLYGDGESDTLYGGQGNDILTGGLSADLLVGEDGFDVASYSGSNGVLADLQFAPLNLGEAAGDLYFNVEALLGSQNKDELRGDSGANIIWGGAGDDVIYGRDGHDFLIGEAGNDFLSGGSGSDTFIFSAGGGRDTIVDFVGDNGPGDIIQLSTSLGVHSYADVRSHATQTNGSVQITFDSATSITIANTTIDKLAMDDFVFI